MRLWLLAVLLPIHLVACREECFLLYDLTDDIEVMRLDSGLCAVRLQPCSTFKIPNALIALELDVLRNEPLLVWDGTSCPYPVWEQDHTLASGIRYSVVWFFQEVARRVGMERYRDYLARLNYGNQDPSSDLETFWLGGGSLLITPEEQLDFLNRLYRGQLPVSDASVGLLKAMLIQEAAEDWVLSGKTGSSNGIGWFIGHLKVRGHEYTFVSCLVGDAASGVKAQAVAKQHLLRIVQRAKKPLSIGADQ